MEQVDRNFKEMADEAAGQRKVGPSSEGEWPDVFVHGAETGFPG